MPIEFRILGPLTARANGRVLPLGSPKQRALLGLLLIHANETVSRERLVEELWAEAAPATVDSAVHVYLSRLRKLLESAGAAGILVRDTYGYKLLVGSEQLDAYRFERLVGEGSDALATGNPELAAARLREALTLWSGPAFADLQSERFAVAEAARLDERRLSALEQRIEADLARGRHLDLIAELEVLADQYPLHERFCEQLMLALYRSGRQAEALQVFRATRREFSEQLGIEPGAGLQRLERAILTQDPSLELPASPPSARRRTAWLALAAAALLGAVALGVAVVTRVGAGSDAGPSPPHTVGVIDPRTNRLVSRIAAGLLPSALATGAGYAWVAHQGENTLSAIDLETEKVTRTFALSTTWNGAVSGVTFGQGAAWVANASSGGTVTKVDYQYGPDPPIRVEPQDQSDLLLIAAAGDGVWVASTRHRMLYEVDAATGRTVVRRPLRRIAVGLAARDAALWMLSVHAQQPSASLTRVDLETGRTAAEIQLPFPATALAVGFGSVWVAVNAQDIVLRIDPHSGTVEKTIAVGEGPNALVVSDDAVWVANARGKTVSRIDPQTSKVVATVPLASTPGAIASGGGKIWVTNV